MSNLNEYIKQTKEERQKHLNLDEDCLLRGGTVTQFRGVLAEYLGTAFPAKRQAVLAHACNNAECSNPRHLYWATYYENIVEDGRQFNTHANIWERTVAKYGEEEARKMQGAKGKGNTHGKKNKGVVKSELHKKRIASAIRLKHLSKSTETFKIDDGLLDHWRSGDFDFSRFYIYATNTKGKWIDIELDGIGIKEFFARSTADRLEEDIKNDRVRIFYDKKLVKIIGE